MSQISITTSFVKKDEGPSSDQDDGGSEAQINCLFCFTTIPSSASSANVLEDVVPFGDSLQIRLDNPSKNRQAFSVLCHLLNVDWRVEDGPFTINHGLPLCFKCQTLYQEVFQLHVQIKELKNLMDARVQLIKKKISNSCKVNTNPVHILEKINNFRSKIVKGDEEGNNFDPLGNFVVPKIEPVSYFGNSDYDYEDNLDAGNDFDLHEGRSGIDTDFNEESEVQSNEESSDSDSDYNIKRLRKKRKPVKALKSKQKGQPQTQKKSCLTCHLCEVVIQSRTEFKNHYRDVHPEEKKYTCKYCGRHFRDLHDVTCHQYTHRKEKHFQCSYCHARFNTKRGMQGHVKNYHERESLSKIFACDKCDKSFIDRRRLQSHLITHSRSGSSTGPKLTCHICDEVIVGRTEFQAHYKNVHPEENKYTCKYCGRHFKDLHDITCHQRTHTKDKPFECQYCQARFNTKKGMQGHIKHFHERESLAMIFACDKCDKSFIDKRRLQLHMDSHSELVIMCKSCGIAFKSAVYFQHHNRKAHNGEAECTEPMSQEESAKERKSLNLKNSGFSTKCHVCWTEITDMRGVKAHFETEHPGHDPKRCAHCGKTFGSYTDCRRHALRHVPDLKPFQCDQCPRRFYSTTELKCHSATHIPEAERIKYVCEQCATVCSSKIGYYLHLKNHERGNVPFVCEQCGAQYKYKRGYDIHKKTVHAKILPYKCSQCPKEFGVYSVLTKHERTHSKVKPYRCPFCEKCFPHSTGRTRHVREVHRQTNFNRKKQKLGNSNSEQVVENPEGSASIECKAEVAKNETVDGDTCPTVAMLPSINNLLQGNPSSLETSSDCPSLALASSQTTLEFYEKL